MYFEIVYAGGNTMKFDEIRRMARNNEVGVFFKELYYQSVKLLESIPDEKMAEILSKSRNGRDGEDPDSFVALLGVIYPYHVGVVDGFVFKNVVNEDGDERNIDKVWISVDVMYVEGVDEKYNKAEMSLHFEEEFCLESCFDYRHLSMKLSLGENCVIFSRDDEESYVSVQDKVFLEALKNHDFLDRIFGEYLVNDYGDGFFEVSCKFFEE